MSEGIQRKKNLSLNLLASTDSVQTGSNHEEVSITRTADPSASSIRRAWTPRAGAVVVEAYARVYDRRNRNLIPDKVLVDYIDNLIDRIGVCGGVTEKERNVSLLLDAIEISSKLELTFRSWKTEFILSTVSFLQKLNSSTNRQRIQKIVNILQSVRLGIRRENMSPVHSLPTSSSPNDGGMSSIISGIADRISFADDGASAIVSYLTELGPSCTRSTSIFRDILFNYSRATGPINEQTISGIIYFFSDKMIQNESNGTGLSSSLLSSIISNRAHDAGLNTMIWNLEAVAQVLNEDFRSNDWIAVAAYWDTAIFKLRDATQFQTLLDLYISGASRTPPLLSFTGRWRNTTAQLSCLEAIMSVPPNAYMVPLNDEEAADAATSASPLSESYPNQQCWASMDMLQRLLQLSDIPGLYRRVRDLFLRCLRTCPEVILCSLVRLLTAQREQVGESPANSGMQIKKELMRELMPLFFRPGAHHTVRNAAAALRRLYVISPTTVMAACFESWRSTSQESANVKLSTITHIINIARLSPNPADAVANLLSGSRDAEYSIAIAFVMSDSDFLQLKPWLAEKLSNAGLASAFAGALVSYLRKTYNSAGSKATASDCAPLVSLENISTTLLLLQTIDSSILASPAIGIDGTILSGPTLGDNVRTLIELCLSAHPSLRPSIAARAVASPNVASDDVEEMATAYFQKIYTSEQSIGEVVEMLKRFKTSGNTKENEIFACMVHNLFDEYRFFAKYPEKELRITGILFGALIQERLVSGVTLGVALRYVLEALRKPPSPPNTTTSTGKMFKFGMFALEQFKGRLHEWPQYCSHIVQIPHLKDGYAVLLHEIEQEMTKNLQHSRAAVSTTNSGTQRNVTVAGDSSFALTVENTVSQSSSGLLSNMPDPILAPNDASTKVIGTTVIQKARVAEFGKGLGRAVTEGVDEERDFETPTDAILDKVQFLVNNLAPANVEKKAVELKEMLNPKYFGWLGHFLVVKRISTQANFHSLYLSFLDHLGEYGKGLVEAILNSAFRNIGKLLRSPKITTSSSERSYLKNLGIWLGQITLARNRPIMQVMLDCKELLLQGYETGKLIAVAPFLAKTLEGAKNSIVFKPPNPWLMGLLGVFRAVYNVEGLKMNIKFEVEVLCKNLSIKLEDIPVRSELLQGRIAPVKERNPDFNIKTTLKPGVLGPEVPALSVPTSDDAGRTTPTGEDQQDTVIPNLKTYVIVNPSLLQLIQSQGGSVLSSLTTTALKRWVPIAVDRAIREIIQPVVERSVSIACTTTKEIVIKDFAMEGDESKMRKAGQLMVANLAGSLALVTCREPLRASVSSHLRQLLSSNLGRSDSLGEHEQNVIEQCVQICATDNLELGCRLIEKAATEKAIRDVEDALSPALTTRRKHREQTGQPFFDMSIFANSSQRYPASLPDQLRPKPGGLQTEHFQLYESFQRLSRQNQSLGAVAPATGSASSASTRAGTPSSGGIGEDVESGQPQKAGHFTGAEMLGALVTKLDASITALLAAAGNRSRDIKLSMLPSEHQICQLLSAIKQVMPNSNGSGGVARPLTSTEQDLILSFSQGVFKRLYELSLNEPLRLEAFVSVLENINSFCPKLGKDLGTWATYAPTNTDTQRRLHRTMLLLLLRSRLLAVSELDNFLAVRVDNGRNLVWVEFSLVFVRTAFVEHIASPPDFPNLMELMACIANGNSQATPQIAQAVRKPIIQMLEETRPKGGLGQIAASSEAPSLVNFMSENSSLSVESLLCLFDASLKIADAFEGFARTDPNNFKQQVITLLESWFRIQSEVVINEKAVTQYSQVLQQLGIGKVDEQTERFLRLSVLAVLDSVLKTTTMENSNGNLNYAVVDLYSKLLQLLLRQNSLSGLQEQNGVYRLSMLNKILGVIIRNMVWNSKKVFGDNNPWDQRPWFRLILNLLIDINKPEPIAESIRLGTLSIFGAAFHVCQPLVIPGFAFAWLELVSHRHFLPNLLLFPGQKAWHIAHQLLIDLFLFLEPYLRRIDMTQPIKKLYEGTLRVLLVVLHDFPAFLSGFYLSFCNVIPDTCVQLRNIILSASPKGMVTPDPFTPNLKIDLLPEISQAPVILSNVIGPIDSIRVSIDTYLKDGQRRNVIPNLLHMLCHEGTTDVVAARVNSLVVYVGAHALARIQSSQISLSRTPDIELFQALMEFEERGRYVCLNAIANQLRFPSSHSHYFSCVMLYLFSESKTVAVKEQVTRVLLERLIVNRPHPWGLLITFIELIKNQRYGFWNYPFTRCATEIEKVFESVARSCLPPGTQRSTLVVGDEQ